MLLPRVEAFLLGGKNMNFPRIMIAGVQSGVGKTTLTLGIMAALKRKGLKVQPYKIGPDYIDPGIHYHAAGSKSHNLDSWMGNDQVIKTIFCKNSQAADISIVEGVMGLFDGAKGERLRGSSAHVAISLGIPVILVVNVKGMARSCLALIKGFKEFEPELNLQGVILNNAGSDYYKTIIKNSIETELGIKVLGCLSKNKKITMPERHLGLLPAEENQELNQVLNLMADMVEEEVDLQGIINIAQSSAQLNFNYIPPSSINEVTIGVARDKAFNFYYQDSLDFLQELGAKLEFFSPLNDTEIPQVDGLYIGGGFPEMFMEKLTKNHTMISSIKNAYKKGMPIFAECGGFIYLSEKVVDLNGNSWSGVGLVPTKVEMTKKLAALGYVQAKAINDSILIEKDNILRGHEFHYSVMSEISPEKAAFELVGGKGPDNRRDGYVHKNLLATYVHIHLRSNPEAAQNFIDSCWEYRSKRECKG